MSELITMLIRRVKEVYPTLAEYNENPETAFSKLEINTRSKSSYKEIWMNVILRIQQNFPETYTEDRTIPDEYDPGIRMHFYDKSRNIKLVFIKSLLANTFGVYAIDGEVNVSYDTIDTDHSLTDVLAKYHHLKVYFDRICEILLEAFPDHFLYPTEADKLTVDNIVAPLAGDGGIGKPVKLFYLLFDDNIW